MVKRLGLALLLLLGLMMVACSPRVVESVASDDENTAATVTAQAYLALLPPDVPIHENAVKLKFAAGNTYISYEVLGTLDEIAAYYHDALISQGWEKNNNSNEVPIGGALTLLRSKPDKNISVTIQTIPESEYVRVLISVITKTH
jgi:hypothetical protein